jgi:hypothetical protein
MRTAGRSTLSQRMTRRHLTGSTEETTLGRNRARPAAIDLTRSDRQSRSKSSAPVLQLVERIGTVIDVYEDTAGRLS